MKRLITVFLTLSLMICAMPVIANAQFSDLPADHWAFSQVERLVAEGTINGLPDGTYNPTGVVSRAEFVKMLGKSEVVFEEPFQDVHEGHWAYDYIMASQLEARPNGNFEPDSSITRGEVAKLLYTRFADGAVTTAPYVISSQGTSSVVTSWVYNTGLMVGGDMINLRMEDTLTRAEAAVLIVRAKDLNPSAYTNFADRYSDETLKNVYEKSNLFDTPYEANGNITYEELSVAAIRYQYKMRTPAISYDYSVKYDGDYAKYWDIACNYALDEKNYGSTFENAQKFATVEDAVAVLTLGARNNQYVPSNVVKSKVGTYKDVELANTDSKFAQQMIYAYNFGITLNADGTLGAKNLVTKKEIAKILMQYDFTFGSQRGFRCGYMTEFLTPYTRLDSASYPSNSDYYANIAEDIPNYVYETPFKTKTSVEIEPRDFVTTSSMLGYIYAKSFIYISENAYQDGADIYIDFYPSLALRLSDRTELYRVKITVKKAYDSMMLSDILALGEGVSDRPVKEGDIFWCDINSNQATIGELYIEYHNMTIDQILG